MKNFILIFLLFFSSLKSQDFDITYYLLGATDQYMGRNYPIKDENYKGFIIGFDEIHTKEINRIEKITGLKFEKNLSLEKCFTCRDYYLKSDALEKEINAFFNFKKIGGSKLENGEYNYRGVLNFSKVKTSSDKQLLSFVAGAFLIHGGKSIEKDGDYEVYEISVANAKPKFEALKYALQKLGIYLIKEEIWYKIPVTYHLKFEPEGKLKEILDESLN